MFLFYSLLFNRKSIIDMGCGAGQPNISQEIVKNLIIVMPSTIEEQQAIASVLSSIDNEIAALEAKRKKYEAVKQGMMQQLLTGKIRLI
jgi:type I restriction enzyme S subunit